jgi:hypothetical protein
VIDMGQGVASMRARDCEALREGTSWAQVDHRRARVNGGSVEPERSG